MKQYLTVEGNRAEIVAALEQWRDHWTPGHRDLADTCQRALDVIQDGASEAFAVGTKYIVAAED